MSEADPFDLGYDEEEQINVNSDLSFYRCLKIKEENLLSPSFSLAWFVSAQNFLAKVTII